MASRSSRPKSDSLVTLELAERLLEDGARISEPTLEVQDAASRLEREGLLEISLGEAVRCSEPRDRDFPPRNRHCSGLIRLDDGLDEDADEITCPDCQRVVRPFAHRKLRRSVLDVSVRHKSAVEWIRRRLEHVSPQIRELGTAAFHLQELGSLGVTVCVIDADGPGEDLLNRRDTAAARPVCYITLDPRSEQPRLLQEPWICHVRLAELVSGHTDLGSVLADLASRPQPSHVSRADIPVFARGHTLIQSTPAPTKDRLFHLQLTDSTLLVDGVSVIGPQAGPRLDLVRILWRQHLHDLASGVPASGFNAMSVGRLIKQMKTCGHSYNDETSLRRLINNFQSDVENFVKRRIGAPIDREDIIQTCPMSNQADRSGGYRLNPYTVSVRAYEPE